VSVTEKILEYLLKNDEARLTSNGVTKIFNCGLPTANRALGILIDAEKIKVVDRVRGKGQAAFVYALSPSVRMRKSGPVPLDPVSAAIFGHPHRIPNRQGVA